MPHLARPHPQNSAPHGQKAGPETFSHRTVFHVFHPVGSRGAKSLLSWAFRPRRAPVHETCWIRWTFAAAYGSAEITALLPRTARAMVLRQTEKDPGKTGGR